MPAGKLAWFEYLYKAFGDMSMQSLTHCLYDLVCELEPLLGRKVAACLSLTDLNLALSGGYFRI